MKRQNGITLIALVVTIIVLLILAGVSITALTDDEKGVVTKAKQAATKTEEASDEENEDIKEIMDYVDSEDWGNSTGNTDDSTEEDSETEVPVTGITFSFFGTEYQMEEGMTWSEWVNSVYYVGSTSYTIAEYEEEFGHLPGGIYDQEEFDEMGIVYVETSRIAIASDNKVTFTGLMYYDENYNFVTHEYYTDGVNSYSYCVVAEENQSSPETDDIVYADEVIEANTNYIIMYWD